MSCQDFTQTFPACKTVTVIEPDDIALTLTSSGSTDEALDESGSTQLVQGQNSVTVTFNTPKGSSNYRFEYLYVDTLTTSGTPGDVEVVVAAQTIYGFTVKLAGVPTDATYVLRWRVVVLDISLTPSLIDAPESQRFRIIQGAAYVVVPFVNQRSGTDYGFSELRVENLVDPPGTQRFIVPQVTQKTTGSVRVDLSTLPDTDNYYLVLRTP